MTNRLTAPCKDCTDRSVGCHGKCEKYQAYRVKVDEMYMLRVEKNYAHDPMNGYLRARLDRRLHAESRKGKL